MVSRPFSEFIHPDDIEPTNARYASQVEEGKDVIEFENRYRCKDGSYRWLLWNAKTAHDKQLIYAIARDVTATRLAEEALERKALQLERSNEELDDFTHVVSHDLKEPLRGIEAFSGFLREDYADTLDEIGRRYLDVLQHSAVRMRDLIDDLLEMSRIGRAAPQGTPVPMDSMMQELRESLAYAISVGGVEMRVQANLPTVICDRVRILQVFENLVSNAVKYNDKKQGAVIEIICEERGDEFVFCVRDNGPGIAPQFQDKIFRIFQRLVRRDEQEGTGVGLALCKKIVEGRGGRIWVESEGDGQGSAFFFTIPIVAPEDADQEVADDRP
jgi:light-regulated signal transduction histidine kinase (bacteriophytochrome)